MKAKMKPFIPFTAYAVIKADGETVSLPTDKEYAEHLAKELGGFRVVEVRVIEAVGIRPRRGRKSSTSRA